jgi:hypothetical protein
VIENDYSDLFFMVGCFSVLFGFLSLQRKIKYFIVAYLASASYIFMVLLLSIIFMPFAAWLVCIVSFCRSMNHLPDRIKDKWNKHDGRT